MSKSNFFTLIFVIELSIGCCPALHAVKTTYPNNNTTDKISSLEANKKAESHSFKNIRVSPDLIASTPSTPHIDKLSAKQYFSVQVKLLLHKYNPFEHTGLSPPVYS